MGPEFNKLWDRYFKDKPDKPVMFSSIVSGAYSDHSLLRKPSSRRFDTRRSALTSSPLSMQRPESSSPCSTISSTLRPGEAFTLPARTLTLCLTLIPDS